MQNWHLPNGAIYNEFNEKNMNQSIKNTISNANKVNI